MSTYKHGPETWWKYKGSTLNILKESIDMKLEEEFNKKLEEGMTVNTTSNKDPNVEDTVIVNADGDDAKELIMMLKNAGMEGEGEVEGECGTCMDTEAPSEMSQGSEQDALMQMLQMAGMDTDNVTVMPLNADCGGQHESVEEDLANAPDEKYADTDYMVNKLAGGINKPKNMYRQAADGDNPMSANNAMPVSELEESLKAEYTDFVKEGLRIIKKQPKVKAPKPKEVKAEPLDKHGEHPFRGKLVGEAHQNDSVESRGLGAETEEYSKSEMPGLEGRGVDAKEKKSPKADKDEDSWLNKKIFGKGKE
jgi:hypothetical protein